MTTRQNLIEDAMDSAGILGMVMSPDFDSGQDYLPASGKVIGREEMRIAVEAILDGWWTEGRFTKEFEAQLRSFLVYPKDVAMVNSGSSANLLALAALKELRNLPDGGEIITSALAFPTTVNPILQLGFKPHFVDVELGTYVPSVKAIKDAINKNTVAIMMAHTLGNPWPVERFCEHLPVVEDNCDAFGSRVADINGNIRMTGTLGDFGTQSFYPAHHITTGEGGAVVCNTTKGAKVVRSLRDWGRDCWCGTGQSNTCGERFDKKFPDLPDGYDHKYVYSRIGYNMKSTDINASIGVAQMARLVEFLDKRKRNFHILEKYIVDSGVGEFYILPRARANALPAWFGFPLTIKPSMPFTATEVTASLENDYKVGTRRIFAGNILRQPAYKDVDVFGEGLNLSNTNIITHNSFWLGIWPGLSADNVKYIAEALFQATSRLLGGIIK